MAAVGSKPRIVEDQPLAGTVQVDAPFSEEEMTNLQDWQDQGAMLALNCPNTHTDIQGSHVLAVEDDGLKCRSCGFKLMSVPQVIADGSMLRSMKTLVGKRKAEKKR